MIEISMLMLRIQRLGISVYFCWVPAHMGVEGNERADRIAKKALKFRKEEILSIPFGKGEAKAVIREAVRELWQRKWDNNYKGRHYHNIQKSINVKLFKGKCRREEVIISRLRFGHTGLNATLFLMAKVGTAKCNFCNATEDVEHVIMKCVKYSSERKRLKEKMCQRGRRWSLEGVLAADQDGHECYRALLRFAKDTGLGRRI